MTASELQPPGGDDLPDGFAVTLSRHTRVRDGGRCLVGGTGGKVVFLAPAAADRVRAAAALVVDDAVSRRLARLLVDAGFADPWWPETLGGAADEAVEDVTVVVPTLDRPDSLRRLLGSLPRQVPVVVAIIFLFSFCSIF